MQEDESDFHPTASMISASAIVVYSIVSYSHLDLESMYIELDNVINLNVLCGMAQ